jgi:predicted transcriptional regulator
MRTPIPTPSELAVLGVLWDQGPSTVREIHTRLATENVYTTVLRTVQIMTDKGFVTPDKSTHAHIYSAAAPAAEIRTQLIKDLLDRGFAGDGKEFVKYALAAANLSEHDARRLSWLFAERILS